MGSTGAKLGAEHGKGSDISKGTCLVKRELASSGEIRGAVPEGFPPVNIPLRSPPYAHPSSFVRVVQHRAFPWQMPLPHIATGRTFVSLKRGKKEEKGRKPPLSQERGACNFCRHNLAP